MAGCFNEKHEAQWTVTAGTEGWGRDVRKRNQGLEGLSEWEPEGQRWPGESSAWFLTWASDSTEVKKARTSTVRVRSPIV